MADARGGGPGAGRGGTRGAHGGWLCWTETEFVWRPTQVLLPAEGTGDEGPLGDEGGGEGEEGALHAEGGDEGGDAEVAGVERHRGLGEGPGCLTSGGPVVRTRGCAHDVISLPHPPHPPGRVHVLSAEEAASGRFSAYDVVLPLVGSDTVFPAHGAADVMRQAARDMGVDLDVPAPHRVAPFTLAAYPGGYRRLLAR